jgi:lipoprotein-releasing system permease protein
VKTSFFIALRYFFAKKSKLVNQISWVSTISIAIGVAALVIVLSAFNGIFNLVFDMYDSIDPDLKIEANIGKSFYENDIPLEELQRIAEIEYLLPVVEEQVCAEYNGNKKIISLKGVDNQYFHLLEDNIVEGEFKLTTSEEDGEAQNIYCCVLGEAIAYELGINTTMPNQVIFYAPTKSKVINLNNAYRVQQAFPVGCFQSILEYDEKFVFTFIDLARYLYDLEGELTSIEIIAKKDVDVAALQQKVKTLIGDDFNVKNKLEMHDSFLKIVSSERLITIIVLSFILLISTFNMMLTLMLIIRDKKKDIATLSAMGMPPRRLKTVFIYEGMLISLLGGLIGIAFASLLVVLQENFGLIKFGTGENFVVSSYPVDLQWQQLILVAAIAIIIALVSSFFAVFTNRSLKLGFQFQE